MKKEPEISVCIIVKNEEKMLSACLESIKDLAGEIIIVDTGSTDNTKEIIKSVGNSLKPYPIIFLYETEWNDDFAAARNETLKYAGKEWILSIDADERLDSKDISIIKELIKVPEIAGYFVYIHNYFEHQKTEGQKNIRLFRNLPGLSYHGIVHEQIFPSLRKIAEQQKLKIANSNIVIHHYGYLNNYYHTQDKFKRNLKILQKAIQQEHLNLDARIFYKIYLANLLLKQKEKKQSKTLYLEIHRQIQQENRQELFTQPVNTFLYTDLFNIYLEDNEIQTALKLIEEALWYFPETPLYYHLLAQVYLRLGSYEEALRLFNTCLTFKDKRQYYDYIPFDPGILDYLSLFGIGACLLKKGHIKEAQKTFQQVLSIRPDFAKAKQILSRLQQVLG